MNNYILKEDKTNLRLNDVISHILVMQNNIKTIDLALIKKDIEDLYYIENLGIGIFINFDLIDEKLSYIEKLFNDNKELNIINYNCASLLVEISNIKIFNTNKYFTQFGFLNTFDEITNRVNKFEEDFGVVFQNLKRFIGISNEASNLARSIFETLQSDDLLTLTNYNYGITINFDYLNKKLDDAYNKKSPNIFLQMILSEIKEELKTLL